MRGGKQRMKKNARDPVDIYKEKDFDPKYKTELCKTFEDSGFCPYGNKCRFAHGRKELFEKSEKIYNYKLKDCKSFHTEFHCIYGSRCLFKHAESIMTTENRSFYQALIKMRETHVLLHISQIKLKNSKFQDCSNRRASTFALHSILANLSISFSDDESEKIDDHKNTFKFSSAKASTQFLRESVLNNCRLEVFQKIVPTSKSFIQSNYSNKASNSQKAANNIFISNDQSLYSNICKPSSDKENYDQLRYIPIKENVYNCTLNSYEGNLKSIIFKNQTNLNSRPTSIYNSSQAKSDDIPKSSNSPEVKEINFLNSSIINHYHNSQVRCTDKNSSIGESGSNIITLACTSGKYTDTQNKSKIKTINFPENSFAKLQKHKFSSDSSLAIKDETMPSSCDCISPIRKELLEKDELTESARNYLFGNLKKNSSLNNRNSQYTTKENTPIYHRSSPKTTMKW